MNWCQTSVDVSIFMFNYTGQSCRSYTNLQLDESHKSNADASKVGIVVNHFSYWSCLQTANLLSGARAPVMPAKQQKSNAITTQHGHPDELLLNMEAACRYQSDGGWTYSIAKQQKSNAVTMQHGHSEKSLLKLEAACTWPIRWRVDVLHYSLLRSRN